MKFNTTFRAVVAIALVAFLGLGSITVGIASSQFVNEFQASVLTTKKIKRAKYSLQKKLRARLVADTENPIAASFDCTVALTAAPEYKAEFVTTHVTKQVAQGDEFRVTLFLKNNGNVPWFGSSSGCSGVPNVRLGTAYPSDHASTLFNPGDGGWAANNRLAMIESRVEPGQIATFAFVSKAPRIDDIFKEYFQPVVEGVKWLTSKQETAVIDVEVGEVSEETRREAFYLGASGQASSLDISGEPLLDVNITTQTLQVKFGNTVIRTFPISSGSYSRPTDIGRFEILNKQELRIASAYPHYRLPYWQGFTRGGQGFHALPYLANDKGVFWTEALTHIGQRVSHGCVRLLDEDAIDLYEITNVGWPVVVHY